MERSSFVLVLYSGTGSEPCVWEVRILRCAETPGTANKAPSNKSLERIDLFNRDAVNAAKKLADDDFQVR